MKTYDEMTKKELAFHIATEIDYYKDRINKLRGEKIPDYKIAAYIHDLWQDCLIADDVELAEVYNISDEDWEKGINYYWYDMEELNPLKDQKRRNKKMDYKNKKYKILINNKSYDDMSQREFDFCVVVEIEYYKDKVNKLREKNIPDYKIVAFLYDLWQDNLIADDAKMTLAYHISNDNWEKGIYYWQNNIIEKNPLKD